VSVALCVLCGEYLVLWPWLWLFLWLFLEKSRQSRQSRQRQNIKGFLTTEDKEGTARKAGELLIANALKMSDYSSIGEQ
jgi:hypothetical protein